MSGIPPDPKDGVEYGDILLGAPLVLEYDAKTGGYKLVTNAEFDEAAQDAFGRLRTSSPLTIFDSKQIHDSDPLRWDDQQTVGATGTASTAYNGDLAMTVIGVDASTICERTRQTFMRFQYQPGKSQLAIMTGILGQGADGITSRIGQFDDDNGMFFESLDGVINVVLRSSGTGTPVDTRIAQADWNLNKLNADPVVDFDKAQIFFIDYEWLGVGRVRFGMFVGGVPFYCHAIEHINDLDGAYTSTPNLPLRYQIANDGSGPAANMAHICTTIISEGGLEELGVLHSASTAPNHIDADTADTIYNILSIRLKATHLDTAITLADMTMINTAGDDYEWRLIWNPTTAGSPSYVDKPNSSIQVAQGATAQTITGGITITRGFVKGGGVAGEARSELRTALRLGASIAGVRDVISLACVPLTNGANIHGSLSWRELA